LLRHIIQQIRRVKTTEINVKDTTPVLENVVIKRTNRQNIILGLLKKKKELTIKDIAQVIKDCSEKTIQRELIAFIDSGVLKRTGERRWSKYSLV
jgi:predicted HTH transcriptional regulator